MSSRKYSVINRQDFKILMRIICSLITFSFLAGCSKPLPQVYFDLNYCDTCLTIGGAIEYEKQNNAIELQPMPEGMLYQSLYPKFNPDYSVRRNRVNDGRIIYAYKYFIELDTIFKLKIIKVYKYLYEENENSLLHRLAIKEIKVKIFNSDPIIDSLYNLPRFTECKYDSLKGIFNFLGKKYDTNIKEKCGKQEGQRKLSREIEPNIQKYPLIKDMNAYYNGCDDFGIGMEIFYNIPTDGGYGKYKNLTPKDMSIYFHKHYYYKNYHDLEDAGYIL